MLALCLDERAPQGLIDFLTGSHEEEDGRAAVRPQGVGTDLPFAVPPG